MKIFILCSFCFCFLAGNTQPGKINNGELSHVFTGYWTAFNYVDGTARKMLSWKDTLSPNGTSRTTGYESFRFIDHLTFEHTGIADMFFNIEEGFILSSSGEVSGRYVLIDSMHIPVFSLGDNVFCYSAVVSQPELQRLGFKDVKTAKHTYLKVVSDSGSTGEMHQITRVTSIQFFDKPPVQFVSLSGYHKRFK